MVPGPGWASHRTDVCEPGVRSGSTVAIRVLNQLAGRPGPETAPGRRNGCGPWPGQFTGNRAQQTQRIGAVVVSVPGVLDFGHPELDVGLLRAPQHIAGSMTLEINSRCSRRECGHPGYGSRNRIPENARPAGFVELRQAAVANYASPCGFTPGFPVALAVGPATARNCGTCNKDWPYC